MNRTAIWMGTGVVFALVACGAPASREGGRIGSGAQGGGAGDTAVGKQGGSGGGSKSGGSGGKSSAGGTGTASGGTAGSNGTGGVSATGGSPAATGGSPAATGGVPGTGGVSGTGGATGGAGGTKATGGTGGSKATGGAGGSATTGGAGGTKPANGGTGGMVAATGGIGGTAQGSGIETRFDFEAGTQGWVDLTPARIAGYTGVTPTVDSSKKVHGNSSLKYTFTTNLADNPPQRVVGVVAGNVGVLAPGKTIKMRLWLPAGHPFTEVQAYILPFSGATCTGGWTADRRVGGGLTTNGWTEFSIVVPANWAGCDPLEMGFFMPFNAAWTGDLWVDHVTLQ